jgi:hypothetical protein
MKKPLAATVCIIVFAVAAGRARAAPCDLSVVEVQTLDWGTLQKPAAGSENFFVKPGDATSGTGTLLYGVPVHGQYKIKSTGNCSAGITILITDTGGASGVTITNYQLKYGGTAFNNGDSGLADPGTSTALRIGAEATYDTSVNIGAEHPTFTIMVSSP